jgi:hypothetical protein
MCNKVKGCNRQIDFCLRNQINIINSLSNYKFKTISSCCGHGKYHKTIVIRIKIILFTNIILVFNYIIIILKRIKDIINIIKEIYTYKKNFTPIFFYMPYWDYSN